MSERKGNGRGYLALALVVSLSSTTHALQSLLSSPALAIKALPSLALASRRSLDVPFAAVLALAQARLPVFLR